MASTALVPCRSIWSLRVGATVLFLHDISDIVVDILRISHDLSIEVKSGWYLAEISFFTNLLTWAYFRLYQFPDPYTLLTNYWHREAVSGISI